MIRPEKIKELFALVSEFETMKEIVDKSDNMGSEHRHKAACRLAHLKALLRANGVEI